MAAAGVFVAPIVVADVDHKFVYSLRSFRVAVYE